MRITFLLSQTLMPLVFLMKAILFVTDNELPKSVRALFGSVFSFNWKHANSLAKHHKSQAESSTIVKALNHHDATISQHPLFCILAYIAVLPSSLTTTVAAIILSHQHNYHAPPPSSSTTNLENVGVLKLCTKKWNKIVAVYVKNPSTSLTALYSHGNAANLGQMFNIFAELSLRIGVNLMGYDYSGYGQSSRKPSEQDT
ncbi:Protein ABHD17A [Vitis vinifera]|uniref:Protein ABHD17A n=1 Tax=Vitis vinifera TaxID=29760 RepID=A0A438DU43_VITVI|nr:Protein ABHD17A [Vitis vinifera]